MSSDGFYVRVGKIEGDAVTLHCLTGFAGGLTDYADSRSFALGALRDARRRAEDVEYELRGAPEDVAAQRRVMAERTLSAPAPLYDAVAHEDIDDEGWCEENVPKYVASCELVARHGAQSEEELAAIAAEIAPLENGGPWPHLAAAWERMHRFDLRVRVTDARYLSHLVPGHEFGTTAYDFWIER